MAMTSFRFRLFAVLLFAFSIACGTKPAAEQKAVTPAPAAAPAAPEQKADTRPVIAAFGDSLTAGYGVAPGLSFPDDLQGLLDEAGYSYHVVNFGVSGNTTTDAMERIEEIVAAKPVVVILEFGGNDGLRGLPVATTRANMKSLIERLKQSGAKVLLAGITLPPNYGKEYISQFDQVYLDLAKHYALPRIPFLLEGVAVHPDLMQNDGIHPTAEGCKIVAGTVLKYLKPLLRK